MNAPEYRLVTAAASNMLLVEDNTHRMLKADVLSTG